MPAETARVLALAFDPDVQTADDAISQRILDAALALAAASGLKHLTMDDVARARRVGPDDRLPPLRLASRAVDALAVRECRRCLATIAAALDHSAHARRAAGRAVHRDADGDPRAPAARAAGPVEPEALLHELTRDDSAVFRLVREFLIGLIGEGQAAGELTAPTRRCSPSSAPARRLVRADARQRAPARRRAGDAATRSRS